MKRKFVSACMAIICVLSCAHISVPAMNAGDKIMVIEDFEGYTSTSNMIAKAFQAGTITAQHDTVAECILSDSEAYSGSKSFGAGGTYTPIQDEYIGGMISPYLLVPEGKRDWTNASYLQFWVKNPVDRRLGIKLQLGDGQTFHTLPASNVNVYLENRPGEGVYNLVSQIAGTYRIWIPSGFEGMVRVPLSLFSTITDFSNIMKIYLGMNVNYGSAASSVKYFYYDYFHVVTSDWQTPVTKQYTPELIDIVVRIDEKNHQLKVSGTINSRPGEENFLLDVVDEYNISCASAHFSSNTSDKTKINYVMKLPKNLPAGNYKLRITTQEFTDFLYEYSFPIYGADTLCCSDIMDTNCESYVEFLHKIGILPGYADGTFKPSQAITYGELIDALAAVSKSSRDVINGYAGSEVAETDAADYNIMLKMILNTLGYTEESSTAYAQRAKELFITNVLGWTGSDNSRGNAAVMLAKALYAEIQEDGTAAKINLLNKNFEAEMDDVRYNSAVAYGDTILKYDRDAYGQTKSAQLIDGINIYTKQPAQYSYGGVTSTISNFTSQQNTLRTLDALSNITGDEKYVNRAKDAVRYTLSNIADSNGTPYMGGHVWWDASREQTAKSKTNQLELKCFFPYYDIWYKTDAALASKAVGAMWDAFMTDWSKALFSRHGSYNKAPTSIWDNNWTDPDPWFKAGYELPFYLTGIDMAVAAYKEQEHTGNAKAGTWAKRVIGMYRKASDPITHLFPDIFVLSGGSSVRDRGLDQFADDFPEETEGFRATEGNIQGTYHTTAASIPDVLSLYDAGLMDSETFNWYVEDYIGYLEYQYVSSEHKNKYILADGTNLEGYELKRDGYFGKAGNVLKSATISRTLLPNAVGLYLRTNNERFWTFARDIASYYGLGDIGTAPGENVALNLATMVVNPGNVFAMCELYDETGCTEYLKLAKAIANNYILYMKRGFFMTPDERSIILNWKYKKVYANFNDKDAWAILRVKAAMDGTGELIPDFTNGVGDVTDNFDGFMGGSDPYERSEIGENCAIFRGEYDIERVMDYNLSGTEITGKQSDEAMITVSGNNINCEMIFSGKVPQSGYKIILALYDATGSIIDCVMPDTVNEFAINGMRDVTFTVAMTDPQAEKTKSAKCFVWSFQTMYPYTQSDLFVVSE